MVMPDDRQLLITNLNETLKAARNAYYSGTPIISDAEYDATEERLKALSKGMDEQPSVLTTVGTDTPGRIKHAHPMRSIENLYTVEEVRDWVTKQLPNKITISPKMDGVSCSLTYAGGKLVKAVTRGDGDAGEDILPQITASGCVPLTIEHTYPIEIRGEIMIAKSTLAELNKALTKAGKGVYTSTRNLAAGTLKLKDLKVVAERNLVFIPWEVIDDVGVMGDSMVQRLSEISFWGFNQVSDQLAGSEDEVMSYLANSIRDLKADHFDLVRDGIVIKVDSYTERMKLGYGSKFANFQVCFKAQNARTISVLRDVVWQVGRMGKMTPVAVIDPVVLAGATVARATLVNINNIRALGLKIGSRVEVIRSGDVIPQILGVVND